MKKNILIALFLLLNLYSFSQSLKLMTYNIRLDVDVDGNNAWSNRKEYFCSQVQFYEPDIVGFQETKPNQITDIATQLMNYSYVGIGREGFNKGESSPIFYKTTQFKLIESDTFWLSETPYEISKGWDAAYNRVCTYALFIDSKTKKRFWVFNTHLDHMGETAKTKGVELILSKIKELNVKNYPIIFMGDFNSEPSEERIVNLSNIMNDSRIVSIEKPFGPSGTFNNFEHNKPVTQLIDYIFISKNPGFVVKKYAVLSDSKDLKYPSDHLPVFVELILKK